jgi:hypothetical protein
VGRVVYGRHNKGGETLFRDGEEGVTGSSSLDSIDSDVD